MSDETHSPMKMITAAYLDPSVYAEEPAAPVSAQSQNACHSIGFEKVIRATSYVIATTLIAAILWVVPANAMRIWAAEKDRRTCGVDWIFWITGSKKTFKGTLLESLEKSRKDYESRSAEATAKLGELNWKKIADDMKFDQEKWNQQFQMSPRSPFKR